jgi:excisionase family DNA binding protein
MHTPSRLDPLELTSSNVTIALSAADLETIAAAVAVRQTAAASPTDSPYMTVREAAIYIRARPQRIYDLLSSRRLPKSKDGTRVLVRRADLDEYLNR